MFSLSGAELIGQCHSQFDMDRIDMCGILETIRVIQGQHGLPHIPFQNERIDSPRIKVACFYSFYVKIQTVRNKIKNCQ